MCCNSLLLPWVIPKEGVCSFSYKRSRIRLLFWYSPPPTILCLRYGVRVALIIIGFELVKPCLSMTAPARCLPFISCWQSHLDCWERNILTEDLRWNWLLTEEYFRVWWPDSSVLQGGNYIERGWLSIGNKTIWLTHRFFFGKWIHTTIFLISSLSLIFGLEMTYVSGVKCKHPWFPHNRVHQQVSGLPANAWPLPQRITGIHSL